MCWGPPRRQRLLPGGAASEWGLGLGTLWGGGKPRCWGWSGNHVPTISCSRTTSPTLLMCAFSPIGRQWGSPGLRAEQALVSGRSHQLGHRLWPEKQTWGIHQSDRTSALDIQQDGGESLCGTLTEQAGKSKGGVPGRGPRLYPGSWQRFPRVLVFRGVHKVQKTGTGQESNIRLPASCVYILPLPSTEQSSKGCKGVGLG